MKINLTKTSFGLAAIAGILAVSGAAKAAAQGDCAAYQPAKPHIYVAGSSAAKPFVQSISKTLAADIVVVYVSQGSCVGVGDMINGTALPTGTDLGIIGDDTCTIPAATKADLGFSDVFPESCADFPDGLKDTDLGDFQGPVQVMNFVVPKGADASITSISAEAAYLVFGFDQASNNPDTGKPYADGTPWTSKDDIWLRGATSGTQSMLAAAIGVPPASWANNAYTSKISGMDVKHAVAGGSTEMVTRIGTPTGNVDATIGILASNELDDKRDSIRGLAYQHYGQTCGFWPDSESSSKDKLNVRIGRYPVWGPLHMIAKADSGKPTDENVAKLIAIINGEDADTALEMNTLVASKNLVPACAMQVSRTSELGNYMSVNPTCSCFYDKARGGNTDGCKVCETDNDCKTGDKNTCSFGFCEAI